MDINNNVEIAKIINSDNFNCLYKNKLLKKPNKPYNFALVSVKYKQISLNGNPINGITKNLSTFPEQKENIFIRKNLKSYELILFFISISNFEYRIRKNKNVIDEKINS